MTPYETRMLKRIRAWQAAPPGWGARLLAKPRGKLAELVQDIVPVGALRAALTGADRLGRKLSDERSILRQAGVVSLAELRKQPLQVCDRLALSVGRRASALGGATGADRLGRKLSDERSILRQAGVASLAEMREQPLQACDRLALSVGRRAAALGGAAGAVFGVTGAAGLVIDVPALLTLALSTVHRTGYCYGERPAADEERRLGIAVFAVVSANSADEKLAALNALKAESELFDAAWRDGVEQITERELAKEAAVYSVQNLARSIGVNLGKRKAAEAIPVIGAVVGGLVNASYLADVAQTARYVFAERWLEAHYPGQLPPTTALGGRHERETRGDCRRWLRRPECGARAGQ